MANPFDVGSACAAAAKRQPMFLPGFDGPTQLGMDFNSDTFGIAWLRKTYTNERTRSIRECLASERHNRRERRLQEVRYGNNITLLFEACCSVRAVYGSISFWNALSRIFNLGSEVTESVVNLFVEARAVYLRNHPPANDTIPLLTTATYWVDKWASFLNKQVLAKPPPPDFDVFVAVDAFFTNHRGRNGDLARILSVQSDVDPSTQSHAVRKRSPSPSALESAPNAKKRTISTSVDWTRHQATCANLGDKEEPHDSIPSTDGYERPDGQFDHIYQEEPYFVLKTRAQAQRKTRKSRSHQDHHCSEPDDHETLVQSNRELQNRVELLEKERLESKKGQKDRDNAIIALEDRLAALERTSAAADTHSAANDKLVDILVQEMQGMAEKLSTQAERLQGMDEQLKLSKQTSQSMQATISSLQEDLATATKTNTEQEESLETQKRESSEMMARVASLEAKSVFLNDIHKSVREIKAEFVAQKDKAANESNEQDTSARLRATEEAMKRQAQSIKKAVDRVVTLENGAVVCNTRIASLESRPETAEDIIRLKSSLSVLDQTQTSSLKELDCRLAIMQKCYEQMQGDIKEFSKRLTKLGNLPLVQFLIPEMQTKIAHIEIRGSEVSKRLHDMEVAQAALISQDQSSRIDELTKTVEALESLPLNLARADDARIEALRAELEALLQQRIATGQAMNRKMDAQNMRQFHTLSDKLQRLNSMCMNNMDECRQRLEQVIGGAGDILWDGKENSVSAVLDSLCQRVSIVENGYLIMRDVISSRRR